MHDSILYEIQQAIDILTWKATLGAHKYELRALCLWPQQL